MGELLSAARGRLFGGARVAGVDPARFEVQRYPRDTIAVSLPLRRDDGSLTSLKAWRCRYDDSLGPTKGGVRYHEAVTADEMQTLAFLMMAKCALMGLEFGGAKGGIQVDPDELPMLERERLARAYVERLARFIGPERDILAPDMGTGEIDMAWMADEYGRILGHHARNVVSGKPVAIGGLSAREAATGRGAVAVLEVVASALGLDESRRRIAIQGFGSAGREFAECCAEHGWAVVAVGDRRGTVHRGDGLDLEAVTRSKDETGRVDQCEGAESLARDEILRVDCDLLVPAALGGQITELNAGDLSTSAILEVANGPVSPDADERLRDLGVTVGPDILANAGGVFVSWLEWQQGRNASHLEHEATLRLLGEHMQRRAKAVLEFRRRHACDIREAAYGVASEVLGRAIAARGACGFARG